MKEYKLKIKTFLFQYIRNQNVEDDTDIFASGFVSSLFAMQLISFLENEFAITIDNEDLNLDNFRSINALALLVEKKAGKQMPAQIQA